MIRVDAHGFARTRRARDQCVRHLGDIGDHKAARVVLAQGHGQAGRIFCALPGFPALRAGVRFPARRWALPRPRASLPGMGASMRTLMAARLRAISSASEVMRLTLMPGAGLSSNRVTAGPCATPVSRVSTPKLRSVSSRRWAFAASASRESCAALGFTGASNSMGG